MVSQGVLSSRMGARRIQPKARPRAKVVLSAEARAILRSNQREKTHWFRKDLAEACQSLDKMTKRLASKHHKSVRRVQNGLHLGHVKFRSRRNKINPWNVYCWKKRRHDHTPNESNGNGIFFLFAQELST